MSEETAKEKFIICGDVKGNFDKFFKKIKNLTASKGPFSGIFCVGEFFAPDADVEVTKNALRNHCLNLSTNMYILSPIDDECLKFYAVLPPEIMVLEDSGIYTTTGKVRIAYVGGIPEESPDKVKALETMCLRGKSNSPGVHILLTSLWPMDATKLHTAAPPAPQRSSAILSRLATAIMPKYHFCGAEGIFYERPPFLHTREDSVVGWTRLVGLGSVDSKEKWIFGLHLDAAESFIELKPYGCETTPIPYSLEDKKKPFSFFYSNDEPEKAPEHHKKRHKRAPCWFCMSEEGFDKELMVDISASAYIAICKGSLAPDHVLIAPMSHVKSIKDINDPDVMSDIRRLKSNMRQFYESRRKRAVFFERNYKTSHAQIQCVGVPNDVNCNLESLFKSVGIKEYHIRFSELHSDEECMSMLDEGMLYFHVDLGRVHLLHVIQQGEDFPLEFGRRVLCDPTCLNAMSQVNWRDCQNDEAEGEHAKQLRKAFQN